jgi:hypothetical protein
MGGAQALAQTLRDAASCQGSNSRPAKSQFLLDLAKTSPLKKNPAIGEVNKPIWGIGRGILEETFYATGNIVAANKKGIIANTNKGRICLNLLMKISLISGYAFYTQHA